MLLLLLYIFLLSQLGILTGMLAPLSSGGLRRPRKLGGICAGCGLYVPTAVLLSAFARTDLTYTQGESPQMFGKDLLLFLLVDYTVS